MKRSENDMEQKSSEEFIENDGVITKIWTRHIVYIPESQRLLESLISNFQISHRHSKKQNQGEVILFFGCRHPDKDYIYGEELEAYHKEGSITQLLCFHELKNIKFQ